MKRSDRGGSAPDPGRPWLVIDTATGIALLALGDGSGRTVATERWVAGFRHGEELLVRLEGMLAAAGLAPSDLGAIVVGTGPGAFTGLRVGLATAKGLAYALDLPIAGISSGAGLLEAARGGGYDRPAILLPAGPNDRVLVELAGDGSALVQRLPGGTEPDPAPGVVLVAIDLEGRAAPDALARADGVRDGLAAALLRLAAPRLAAGGDDLATLVPEYVTAPRGVVLEGGPVTMGRG